MRLEDFVQELKPQGTARERVERNWHELGNAVLPTVRPDFAPTQIDCSVLNVEQPWVRIQIIYTNRNPILSRRTVEQRPNSMVRVGTHCELQHGLPRIFVL